MSIYTLRPATWNDIDFMFGIMCAVSQHKDGNREAEYMSFVMEYDPAVLQVIQCEGRDVGQLRVAHQGDRVYVGRIQIQPGYQRRGIGFAILSCWVSKARSAGVPVELEVHIKNNDARRLYERLGFSIIGWGKYENKNKRNIGYYWKMRCLP